MKKLFICLIAAIMLSNCDISVKKSKAQFVEHATESVFIPVTSTLKYNDSHYGVEIKRIKIDNMEIALFMADGSHSTGTPFVINLTKEKLEIELLKKQLK